MNSSVLLSTFEDDNSPISVGASVFVPSEYFVTSSVREKVEIILDWTLSFVVALLGVVNNVLVIIVFTKQGFKETVNISMTFIAVWDLVKCLGAAMQRTAGPMQLISKADAESWTNIGVVAFNYLISFSSYVSCVLAALVAIERCLCVSMPFKVKDIITPKVTFISCMVISVGVFGAFVIIWSIYDIHRVFHPGYNRSVYVYQYNDFFYQHRGPIFEYYNVSGIIWPILSFVIISSCTVVIVYHLRKSSQFRSGKQEVTDSSKGEAKLSARDRQVVKMLLVIIVVYIVTLTPRIILYLIKYFIYEFYFLRLYHNVFTLVCYFIFFFDILNAAVNLYVFLAMSTSFRSTFVSLFSCLGLRTKR